MVAIFSSNKVRLNGSDIQVALASRDEEIEPWLLAAVKQGRTRTVAAVFGADIDTNEVRRKLVNNIVRFYSLARTTNSLFRFHR